MSQLPRAQLNTQIQTLFPDNTSREITPSRLRTHLVNEKDSFVNLTDDAWMLGLRQFSVMRTYPLGWCVTYNYDIYQCLANNVAGMEGVPSHLPTRWRRLTQGNMGLLPEWDNGTSYTLNAAVSRNQQIYRSLVPGNTGNVPEDSPGQWELQSEAETPTSTSIADYAEGVWTQNALVRFPNGKLWRLAVPTLFSTLATLADEVQAGSWLPYLHYQGLPYLIDALTPLHVADGHEYRVGPPFILADTGSMTLADTARLVLLDS